jgi:hypothetical protein
MRRASTTVAALIYAPLFLLGVAQTKNPDEGGRCIAVQQRLAELRAEIKEFEKEADAACSVSVTPIAPHPPTPPRSPLAQAVSATESPDVPFTTSGHRRRQTSGTAHFVLQRNAQTTCCLVLKSCTLTEYFSVLCRTIHPVASLMSLFRCFQSMCECEWRRWRAVDFRAGRSDITFADTPGRSS